jgi:hypothetical protein
MFTITKETEASYAICTEQGDILAHAIGLPFETTEETRVNVMAVLDFLNDPLKKSSHGFSPLALRAPSFFPGDDDADDIIGILAPNHNPLVYVSDYGQGVALCEQLNRALR